MYSSNFNYHAPASVQETLALMQQHGDAKLLAGGHSLLPAMKLRLSSPEHLIDLKNLRDSLSYIRDNGDHLAIGALTTYYQIESSSLVAQKCAVLAQTVSEVGDMMIRNAGTIGGSIAHADPSGDPPAAILAADASMVIQGADGERIVPATEFFHGFFETAVQPGELLTEIRVPVQSGSSSYQKYKHPASGYAVCGVAVVLEKSGAGIASCRVAVTGAAGSAYRATAVEAALSAQSYSPELAAQAAQLVTEDVELLEDSFADTEYRQQIARTLTRKALEAAWG